MQNYESNVAALEKRGEQLAIKRLKAQNTLDKATKARQDALLSGDLNDQRSIDRLQGEVDSAMSALAGIEDALAILAQQKTEAENQLIAERESIARAKASEEIAAAAADIERRCDPMLGAMRKVSDALTAIDHLSFEVGQLGKYLSSVAGEAEIALAFVLPELRRLAQAVKDGSAPIRSPKLPPEPLPPIEPPPTMTVFMMRSAKYRDHDGRTQLVGQYTDASMPVATAQRALRSGAATTTADPRRAQLRGARGADFNFKAPDVVDLNALEPAKVQDIGADNDPIASADFRTIDRSAEAFTLEIAVPRS